MYNDFVVKRTSTFTLSLIKSCKSIHNTCSLEDNLQYEFFLEDDFTIGKKFPRLYYGTLNNKIVGFLSVYLIDEHNCEICLFVLPKYRGAHLGNKLISEFENDYNDFHVEVSVKPDNSFGKNFINSLNFQYNSSNILMEIDLKDFATHNNVENIDYEYEDGYFYYYQDNIPIGSCLVTPVLPDCACLSEVAIDPDFQNKGYGYIFLSFIFKQLSKNYNFLILHVEKENIPACRLYEKLGFVPKEISLTYAKTL